MRSPRNPVRFRAGDPGDGHSAPQPSPADQLSGGRPRAGLRPGGAHRHQTGPTPPPGHGATPDRLLRTASPARCHPSCTGRGGVPPGKRTGQRGRALSSEPRRVVDSASALPRRGGSRRRRGHGGLRCHRQPIIRVGGTVTASTSGPSAAVLLVLVSIGLLASLGSASAEPILLSKQYARVYNVPLLSDRRRPAHAVRAIPLPGGDLDVRSPWRGRHC